MLVSWLIWIILGVLAGMTVCMLAACDRSTGACSFYAFAGAAGACVFGYLMFPWAALWFTPLELEVVRPVIDVGLGTLGGLLVSAVLLVIVGDGEPTP